MKRRLLRVALLLLCPALARAARKDLEEFLEREPPPFAPGGLEAAPAASRGR